MKAPRVASIHRPGALTTAVVIMFGVGEADLPDSERGLLHVCEHLKLRTVRQRREITGLTNGITSKDWVLFTLESHNDVIVDELASFLEVLFDAETMPTDEDILSEVTVIRDEIRQHQSSIHGQLQLLEEQLWEKPFCLPACGLEHTLSGLTAERIATIWRDCFSVSKCVIAAVGGVSGAVLEQAIPSAAADQVPQKEPPAPRIRNPGWCDLRKGDSCTVVAGIPLRGLWRSSNEDLLAMQMLAAILETRSTDFTHGYARSCLLRTAARQGSGPMEHQASCTLEYPPQRQRLTWFAARLSDSCIVRLCCSRGRSAAMCCHRISNARITGTMHSTWR